MNGNTQEKSCCIVCGRQFEAGEGRYNTHLGPVCLDCYPVTNDMFPEKAKHTSPRLSPGMLICCSLIAGSF